MYINDENSRLVAEGLGFKSHIDAIFFHLLDQFSSMVPTCKSI